MVSLYPAKVPEADMVIFARVLHDFYDDAALQLLKTAFHALKKGGRVAVVEPPDSRKGAFPLDGYISLDRVLSR